MKNRPKVLVVFPTCWERTEITRPEQQERFEFVICCEELYDSIGVWNALRFDVRKYLQGIANTHRHDGFSAILGTGDYPGCMFAAYLGEELGLPTPRTRETVLLSHKFYSREVQRSLVPEATPPFALLDPHLPVETGPFPYPFFVKPVKGTMSIRAQMVHELAELRQAITLSFRERLRAWVLLKPYAQLLSMMRDKPILPHCFVAEAPLRGIQVTVDGFVQNGISTVIGITDSIMYPGTSSFARFEYPSSLPPPVQTRIIAMTNRLMQGSGFDHSCYNVEFFYDEAEDRLSVIEINPRMSYQFSDLFEHVDGRGSFSIQLALAMGQPVNWQPGRGSAKAAASFVMRRFRDALVISVPTAERIAEVEKRFGGAHVKLLCAPGERLSDRDQDVGSFRYCIVNMHARSREQLAADYSEACDLLLFGFAETNTRFMRQDRHEAAPSGMQPRRVP
ncbi:MAG TPA: ATP-grasp domain-containing protein [Polyangium sp.]|nr:ATP-grasp domain-containing protein [Polyangium sp.]